MRRAKIVFLTILSGLAELLAALAFLLSRGWAGMQLALAFAAGVMTYITADELIPVAHESLRAIMSRARYDALDVAEA